MRLRLQLSHISNAFFPSIKKLNSNPSGLTLTLFRIHQKNPALVFRNNITSSALSTTPTMEGGDIVESPRKRIKTDNASSTAETAVGNAHTQPAPTNETEDAQLSKELEVGITQFVSSQNVGFSGIFKKRYTDFLVNEILTTGEVLHLRSIATPQSKEDKPAQASAESEPTQAEPKVEETKDEAKEAEFQLSDEGKALLESYFGPENTNKIISLHKKGLSQPKRRPADLGKVHTIVISDRDHRIQVHQAIRRIFSSQLESSTDHEGVMVISVSPNRNNRGGGENQGRAQRGNRVDWGELGGTYLHFTIYKENKDTMETISRLSRELKVNPRHFQFAGTKDRRGVTVQRASAQRLLADRLAKQNANLWNAELGDFEYCPRGLDLGDLNGNEFVITLRECEIPGVDLKDSENAVKKATEVIGTALRDLHERGYFNYYGLQRFGTFATRTDAVGVKMLQGDFKAACDAILHFSPHVLAAAQAGEESTAKISSDDKARAEAIHLFQTTDRINDALAKIPRKFTAEDRLIRHLSRARNDYMGALQIIPRNLRLMYVHAYQSLVWNYAAGERWRLYGDKVVEGDLVLVHEHRDKEVGAKEAEDTVDEDGEIIVVPKAEDSAHSSGDIYTRARALTAEEASNGKYSIFDIVLPLPGFDILYPPNKMTDFYKNFMGSEQGGGLDPFDMRRKWKDLSLSGSYRKILSRMGPDYSFQVKLYSDDDQKFVQTDLEVVRGEKMEEIPNEGDKLAVVLKFQLGTSQYATMALRELMRGNAKTYVPDFSGGR